MKLNLLFVIIFIPFLCFGYEWMNWGPTGINTNDFYVKETGSMCEVICAEDGLYIQEDTGWNHYSYGFLPVIGAADHLDNDFLVVIGDGSYSDGVYTFDLNTHEFTVREWCVYPNFIKHCSSNGKYYVGYYYGLLESEDGISWTNIAFFENMNCVDLIYHENHLIVSELSNIAEVYCSDDYGENWTTISGTPFIKEMIYDQPDLVYGIYPDFSNSSGIWYSMDHGNSWFSALYTDNLSTIASDCSGNIFVAWADFPVGHRDGGVAWFNQTGMLLEEMNDGLSCFAINQLTDHPLVDCVNIVACTQQGVLMLTDYDLEADEHLPKVEMEIFNAPNPFNPQTSIYLESDSVIDGRIEIFNVQGQKVRLLPISSSHSSCSVIWDGMDNNNRMTSSGIYFYRFRSDTEATKLRKMALIR